MPEAMSGDYERIREFIATLPDASGTFSGTFSTDTDMAAVLPDPPDLFPVEVDTGDEPNPAAAFISSLTISTGDRQWTLPVDHADLLGGNRVRLWVRRP